MSTTHTSAQIDATASVHPSAKIAEGVTIGARAIVGEGCVIGEGTKLLPGCIIVEHTHMGAGNEVHPYAVLGGDPQDLSWDGSDRGRLVIGDGNTFREGMTISRSTVPGGATQIGSGNYLMAQTHIAHDCVLGDRIILANLSILAGHVRIGNGCFLSGHTAVHQFTTVGEMVMLRGLSGVGMHVPPFVIVAGNNQVNGLNRVGLSRRPDITRQDFKELRDAYRMLYRDRGGKPIGPVIEELCEKEWGPYASRFVNFVSDAINETGRRRRGICSGRLVPIRARVG